MRYSLTIPFLPDSGTGSHEIMMLCALVLYPLMFCGGKVGAKRGKRRQYRNSLFTRIVVDKFCEKPYNECELSGFMNKSVVSPGRASHRCNIY